MPPVLSRTALALAVALGVGLSACSKPATDTAAATTVAAAPSAEQIKAESARLNAWFEKKYEEQLQFSPIQLTMLGRKELYNQIDDMSEAGMRRQLAWQEVSVKEMEAGFDYKALDPETQLSWDLWKKQYENARDGMAFLGNGYPFEQMGGMQSFAPTFMINFHKVADENDYIAYIGRLQKLGTAFDQALERARASAAGASVHRNSHSRA
nr:DUF885 family protein [Thermomonas carbonis]